VLNNVFVQCPKRILFGRRADNVSDGNLFDASNDSGSLCIRFPDPQELLNLSGWSEYLGLDRHSTQAKIEASLDVETLDLTLKVDGELPACQPVEAMHAECRSPVPGPFDPARLQKVASGTEVRQRLDPRSSTC
jgi:hypothetical protein